ncbi:MAG: hypothetical protein LBU32_20885 [Clostridiales bacterium]|nr:hypothetical protein [Clostridiales bacterium]
MAYISYSCRGIFAEKYFWHSNHIIGQGAFDNVRRIRGDAQTGRSLLGCRIAPADVRPLHGQRQARTPLRFSRYSPKRLAARFAIRRSASTPHCQSVTAK